MVLHSSQNKIAQDTHRFRVVNCGRRFGKTVLAVEEIKGKAIAKPSKIAYIAPTYQQARDIAWEMLKRELLPVAININESRLEIRVKTLQGGESWIALRGWESIETLRGQAFDFVVLDEVAMMRHFWTNWQEVIRPTLTDTIGEALFISTPKGFNHFYELYTFETDAIKGSDYKSFHFTSYDNPHIPISELNQTRKELTETRFAQEYMADFRKVEGLVYKEFKRERHIFSDPDLLKRIDVVDRLVSIDWGYTNPTAMYLILKDRDNHYWITQEFYKTEQTTDQVIEQAKALKGTKYYPDPAEPDRNEMLRRNGMNVRDVSKDIEAGVVALQELFKQDRIHIWSGCVNLIEELEMYHYPDEKLKTSSLNQNEPELPVKEDDHACDSVRYALYMQEPAGQVRLVAKQFYPSLKR